MSPSAVVSTTQQVGGSIGTALLNTIAATATVSFIASNPPQGADPNAVLAATNAAAVHGFGVAFMWSSIIFAVAIVASLILINAGKDDVADLAAARQSRSRTAGATAPPADGFASAGGAVCVRRGAVRRAV